MGEELPSKENPSFDILMRNAYPELAAAIRGRSPRILERLRVIAREILPSADELTLNELLDHLPQTLEDLATAIASTTGSGQRNFLIDSKQHGVCRFHQSFNLSELMVEYSLLRSILLEEISKALQRSLTVEELSGLNAGIDAAARRSVESFVVYQQHEIKGNAEAQSKYLSFMSHDLRGSLNGILLMMEVLRRELSGSKQFAESLSDLDVMKRSILDTVATMDRFLHAERFRRGKVEVKYSEVNLAAVISDVVQQFVHQAQGKGVAIAVETAACPQITTDRELVTLILQNVIGNAVKFSDKGEVRVFTSQPESNVCRIMVSDQGPGISSEGMKTLFEPFTRSGGHTQAGMGLGLSIARQSADLLGAKLWAESKVGQGTTFFLELHSKGK